MAIVEKQVIRFTPDRRLQGRSVNLGNEGDNMVRRIMFALPDVDEHQAATLMYGGKYADMIQLTAMDGKWAADLTDEMVGAAGEVEGYIRIDGPDGEVWRSDPFRIETGDVPEIEVQIEKLYPTAVGQMLTAMEEHSGKMRESEELLDRLNEETQAAADTARTAAAAADGASLAAAQHRNAAQAAAEGASASEADAEAAAESARRMAAAAQAQAQEAALSAEGSASEAVQAATQADRATAQANQAAAQAQAAGQSAIEAGTQADRASDEADRAYRAAEGFKTPGAQAQQLEAGSQPTAAWERDGSGLPVLKLGIPKGDRGAQGIQGERGPQGVQGIQGKTGPQGERGAAFTYSDFTAAQLEALKGPKGDKGDPGEDAVIDTTLTQAGQAADAKATGGALSQLKDDLADKLPKSPANWEPWTADEQAAARERMGASSPYRHIASIEIEESGVTCIGIETDENGAAFALKNVVIYGFLSKLSANAGIAVAINSVKTEYNGANNIARSNKLALGSNGAAVEININRHKYWRSSIIYSIGTSDGYITQTTGNAVVSYRGASGVRANEWEYLTALSILVNNTDGFGIGTTFDIWGR